MWRCAPSLHGLRRSSRGDSQVSRGKLLAFAYAARTARIRITTAWTLSRSRAPATSLDREVPALARARGGGHWPAPGPPDRRPQGERGPRGITGKAGPKGAPGAVIVG